MKLSVELKAVYGRDLIYPACDQSQLIAELLNVKTLSLFHVRKLKALGYDFETINTNTLNLLFN
tara:strand:+ start:226 stop:417 length:192 start_codon:yes stop_codon:yes gene_type:complete